MSATEEPLGWFCIRSQPKHEHIAAAHLRKSCQVEVFNPQLYLRKATRRGKVWFLEALFPGYLFARFRWEDQAMAIRGTPGVSTIVTFGKVVPRIPDDVIDGLRAQFDENERHEVPEDLKHGDVVKIAAGPFQGFEAKVLRVLRPQSRIQVLLEILGQCAKVEISRDQVNRDDEADGSGGPRSPFRLD